MRRPTWRSLRVRWTLVLVGVCVLEAALVAVAVRVSTERAFRRFVIEEALEEFVADVQLAAQASGSVTAEDVENVRSLGRRPPELPPGVRQRSSRRPPPPASLGRAIAFGLADAEGVVLRAFDGHTAGDSLARATLDLGRGVFVGDQRVATVFVPANAEDALDGLPPGSPEARFVASSTSALVVALVAALAVALGIGVWLAGRIVRPLRRLTDAAGAIAAGDFSRSVAVDRTDEVGALAEAFNTMSARLAEATALRQRMTADISHDLRTPVTTVLGTLELIESGTLEPTPARIRAARVQAERLVRLIEAFHLLALADAGELPVHPARVVPAEVLRQAAAAFEARAQAAGVDLAVHDGGAPAVLADPDRLAQVLDNLVANALRHTPAGGRITLTAQPRLAVRAVPRSPWPTPAAASPPTCCLTCSSGRCAPRARARAVARGSASASSARSWRRWAARSGPRARPATGRPSRSRFRRRRVQNKAGLHGVWTSAA